MPECPWKHMTGGRATGNVGVPQVRAGAILHLQAHWFCLVYGQPPMICCSQGSKWQATSTS